MKPFIFVTPLVVSGSLLLGQTVTVAQSQGYQPSGRIPVADNTLGTQVTGAGNFNITGGVSQGGHLFHSFQEFSVPTGGSATFINPVDNRSIITRVTGGMFSDINGAINTQGANFLLINPNGVVFGPRTQLNVGRIFAVSTADSLDLTNSEGGIVTFGTNLAGDASFLTVNPSALFNVSRFNLGGGGEINNFGTLQTTNPNQYVGLIGGNVSIDGGHIVAPGGQVELGGLSAPGGVDFTNNRVVFPVGVARSDISLKNSSTVDVRSVGGGDITINAGDINLQRTSSLLGGVSGIGTQLTFAGDIRLDAIGAITINSGSEILNDVRPNSVGNSGKIDINASSLSVSEQAIISSGTAGVGSAGIININTPNGSIFIDNALIGSSVQTLGVVPQGGKVGSVNLTGESLKLQNGAVIQAVVSPAEATLTGVKKAGQGSAGNITINITGDIDITGFSKTNTVNRSGIFSDIGSGVTGNAGDIKITAGTLLLKEGSSIGAATAGVGNAGNITINTTSLNPDKNSVTVRNDSKISSEVVRTGTGTGGDVLINTGSLFLTNNSSVSTSTRGSGRAGNVTVNASDAINLDFSNIVSDIGAGGNSNDQKGGEVSLSARSLSLISGATIQTTTFENGRGNAGNIEIEARESVDVSGANRGFASGIFSSIRAGVTGNGGNIKITSNSLSVKDQAIISAGTSGNGNAGTVDISAKDGSISVIGAEISSNVETNGIAKIPGTVKLTGKSLSLQRGGVVQTVVSARDEKAGGSAGMGNAGNVDVNITGDINIAGSRINGKDIAGNDIIIRSGINSTIGSGATGNGGNVTINTGSLLLQNGASINAATIGKGDAGNINITTQEKFRTSVFLDNSTISSDVSPGATGKGGNVNINTNTLSLKNNSAISSGTFGLGQAGNIAIKANDAVSLDGSTISTNTRSGGNSNGGKGATIDLSASSLSLKNGATIQTTTLESVNGIRAIGDAGNITIAVREALNISGTAGPGFNSGIFSSIKTGAVGNAGNIDITANSLSVSEQAIISSGTSGIGNAGKIIVDAKGSISINNSIIASNVESEGVAALHDIEKVGSVTLRGASLSLQNGAVVQTVVSAKEPTRKAGVGDAGIVTVDVSGNVDIAGFSGGNRANRSGIFSVIGEEARGNGGLIDIKAGSLSLEDGAGIAASTVGRGNAGSIKIITSGEAGVSLDNSTISSDVASGATGNGGNVEVTTSSSLFLRNSSSISAGTSGSGRAGNVTVMAKSPISLDHSFILSDIRSDGDSGKEQGGTIKLSAGSLSLRNTAAIQTTTSGTGKGAAGNISIHVENGTVDLSGANNGVPTSIRSSIDTDAEGAGGAITINAGSLLIRDGALLEASTAGNGNAGAINVNASDSVLISGKNGNPVSRLSVSSTSNQSTVTAGNITVDSPKINLDNNGTIESRSSNGTGGNINIGTNNSSGANRFLILRHGAQISTNSAGESGNDGGNINIGSNFVVGIPREDSDVTANATRGNGGNVLISAQGGIFGIQNQPRPTSNSDITASSEVGLSGSININTPGVDPGKNIGELPAAPTDASKQISQACTTNPINNKFVVTGKGGHPPNTDGQLTSETYWQDARDSKKTSSAATANTPLQPAIGWVFDKQGNVTLLAHNSATESTKLKITCPVSPKTLAGGTQLQ